MRQELLIGLVALLLLGGCTLQPQAPPQPPNEPPPAPDGSPQACTEEAKLCPDGSYVGRNASLNCEFDTCPPYAPPPQLASEGEFCGGIAANLPENQCEPGLECVLDGAYPDAAGTCQKPAPTGTDELQVCPPERPEICTEEYNPVCGRQVSGTSEVAGYADYGNPCKACSAQSNAIAYYHGTCLDRGFGNTGTPGSSQFFQCPLERHSACTKEYNPVCGRIMLPNEMQYYRDYGNPCMACSKDSNAIGYWPGGCQSRGS